MKRLSMCKHGLMMLWGNRRPYTVKPDSFASDSAGDLRTSPVALSEEYSDALKDKQAYS